MIATQHMRHLRLAGGGMKQILIVDDFEPGRLLLREKLEMQGYVCQEVENGLEALEILQTKHFDLVLTDNQMPGEASLTSDDN